MAIVGVLTLLVASGLAGDEPEPKGDLAKMQGTWTAKIGPGQDVPLTWIVKADKVTSRVKTADGKDVTTTFTIKVDEKAHPRAFDQTSTVVDFGGTTGKLNAEDSPAIYDLKDDEWKVGLVPIGVPRLKRFEDADKLNVIRFKKVKEPAK